MEKLLAWDQQLTYLIYNALPHNHMLDLFFGFLSLQGSSFIIWLIPLGYIFYVEQHEDRRFGFLFLTSMLWTYVMSDLILKNIIQRLRPDSLMIASNICPASYSFPSSHAAIAFAAAGMLAEFDKQRRIFYYFIAILVAFSRIYLQCHYMLDILAGALIGLGISYGYIRYSRMNAASNKKKKKG